jgi:hypothetical protein
MTIDQYLASPWIMVPLNHYPYHHRYVIITEEDTAFDDNCTNRVKV